MKTTLAAVQALLPGTTLHGDGATPIARVHSDTRTLQAGDLYVALRGDRHDGHDHLAAAASSGAAAVLAERGIVDSGLPGIEVADSRRALGDLAAAWRRLLDLPLVAVTGSNGKTTVTQMVGAIFAAWLGDAALATAGNFNNDIGVPLTLLRLRPHHHAAVVELGMNHPGEIARLAEMAAPTVVLVNNAQREHQEFMDGVEAVARENGAAIAALPADGTAVFLAGSEWTPLWRSLAGARRCCTFLFDANGEDQGKPGHRPGDASDGAEVRGTATWSDDRWRLAIATPAGRLDAELHLPGRHNALNALAATACAVSAGCPLDAIATGLSNFRAVAGRSQLRRCTVAGAAVTLVDDTYNANPDSALAAIDLLAGLPAPQWLVLGDMGEVGEEGAAFHREVGAHARARGLTHVWTAGPLSADAADACPGSRHFGTVEALLGALPAEAPACASALVKGSRFMRMERVVAALCGSEASAC